MNSDVKYDKKPSVSQINKKLAAAAAAKQKPVEKDSGDQVLLNRIENVLNHTQRATKENHHDGDELMALYSINQGKKAKDSQTYRSRMNRNTHTHFKYLKEELREQEGRHGWWSQDNYPID